ncbi:demethylmenaquinone methyltransferase [Sporolactobacillus sp. CQH2019]|uniref:demethylmenaquinone methyltransferase n=1 Tax=Sporolactobacillus sp. CQH2019 TaxID=3023512 RepID=UPI002367F486|nr:demethylmenaquinone methyltransferase [Sporolactobacillus sp. CQH2019]MDD9148656.1 demethylmenaquinone methyltransferase [Sporolactobacillus sp. CQH2019]
MNELEEKHEKVHQVFQSIYKKYDAMNSLISFNRHKAWRRKANEMVDAREGEQILDVCCGTGDWTLSLAGAAGPSGKVVGLDFSENMLKVARAKLEMTPLKNVVLVNDDAMNIPFGEATFDRVTIGFGLRNVPDYLTVLKEMFRVLKPGGRIVCLETSQPEIPVYKQLYFFYFRFIMPLLGKLFAGSYREYAWLNESTRKFPNRKKLVRLFQAAGFEKVAVHSFMGGIAAIHQADKPLEEAAD